MKLLTYTAFFTALSATPALAHTEGHSLSSAAAVAHWLSSPSHSLLTVIGALIVLAALATRYKNRA